MTQRKKLLHLSFILSYIIFEFLSLSRIPGDCYTITLSTCAEFGPASHETSSFCIPHRVKTIERKPKFIVWLLKSHKRLTRHSALHCCASEQSVVGSNCTHWITPRKHHRNWFAKIPTALNIVFWVQLSFWVSGALNICFQRAMDARKVFPYLPHSPEVTIMSWVILTQKGKDHWRIKTAGIPDSRSLIQKTNETSAPHLLQAAKHLSITSINNYKLQQTVRK